MFIFLNIILILNNQISLNQQKPNKPRHQTYRHRFTKKDKLLYFNIRPGLMPYPQPQKHKLQKMTNKDHKLSVQSRRIIV